jgi:two-component system LytT family response regulator
MRALIADDEAPARRKLQEFLRRSVDIEVIGEAADGREAVDQIRHHRPDVVFLDIQMPQLDGFAVISEVGIAEMPMVVFVTAFDDQAIRAFEVQALDYLLKPFSANRLEQVLDRLRRLARAPQQKDWAARIEGLLAAVSPEPQYIRQILLEREAGRQVLVSVGDVDVIRADGNYLVFTTEGGEFRRRGTLADIEQRLDPQAFVRLNRSELARLAAIKELQPWFHGDARVVLHRGAVLNWSRRYRTRTPGVF